MSNIRGEITVLYYILGEQTPNIILSGVQPILGTITLDPYLPPSPMFEYCDHGSVNKVRHNQKERNGSQF
jgi:hypothetical protein